MGFFNQGGGLFPLFHHEKIDDHQKRQGGESCIKAAEKELPRPERDENQEKYDQKIRGGLVHVS
jgi:hypothetical protein